MRVGRVLRPFGVRGFVKCASTTDYPERIAGRSYYLLLDIRTGECVRVSPEEVVLRHDHFIIRFEEFGAPEPLKRFGGWDLVYPAQSGDLPREDGEIYFFELVGLEVRGADGQRLGEVSEVLDLGAHPVLEVSGERQWLLPYTWKNVPEVNLEAGYLVSTYPLPGKEGSSE
ncbi:16S rRNA processing protein RimM [bacterium]|nr:16S rRNA processing protein RimM [bacterium]